MTKFLFVTGGVISGVGKGITAAAIGANLKARGAKVSMQKLDPYFNVDAGLLNPAEHGECFVTKDGAETDLDLGSYERFLDEEMTDDSIATSGKLFAKLLQMERAGDFHGKSVQLVPHFTGLIQKTIRESAAKAGSDIHIVEIGGTVGDLEGAHFIEAIREFPAKVGRENCFYMHVVFVPELSTSDEFKTKPAQNALRDLRAFGLIPDMVAVRLDVQASRLSKSWIENISRKIATFGGVLAENVLLMPNAKSVYEIPLKISERLGPIMKFANLTGEADFKNWKNLQEKIVKIEQNPEKNKLKIALVAKYIDNSDTYMSVSEALKSAAFATGANLEIKWINAEKLESLSAEDFAKNFAGVDGILVPGGFGSRGVEGKIAAADYAFRENIPYLGLCLGLQVAVIASARRAGLKNANSEEFDENSRKNAANVVYIMDGQEGKESTGGTLRLGDYPARVSGKVREIYGEDEVVERHRHRYEVNQNFRENIEKGGLEISGTSPDGKLVEFVDAPAKRFYVATQAHPEFRSRPTREHPLFREFLLAALEK